MLSKIDSQIDLVGAMHSDTNQVKQIIETTINLLNEQRDSYKDVLKQLTDELDSNNIVYTYLDDKGIKVNSLNANLLNIENKYNIVQNKISKISNNIYNLELNILKEDLLVNHKELINKYIGKKGLDILNAQENERNRIARDLHDSVVQTLANLIHKSELCIKTLDKDPIGTKLDLQIMMHTIKNVIDEIRTVIYDLRPMSYDDLGLKIAIDRLLEEYKQNYKVLITCDYKCNNNDIDTTVVALTLFRIIQEALSNAVKHGKASVINLSVEVEHKLIILEIKDNGVGFNVNQIDKSVTNSNSGFGLSTMKERVHLLSGDIMILSEPNKGTTIMVKVPFETREEDQHGY